MNMKRDIYVIGDIHGDYNIFYNRFFDDIFSDNKNINKDNILFIAGDAGFINSYENENSKAKRIEVLNKLPFTIIAVLGNHENYDIIESLDEVEIFGGKCYKEKDVEVYYAKNGQIFNIEGLTFFTYNGGLSYDKEKRLKIEAELGKKCWWPQEVKTEDFEQAYSNFFNHHIDYVITHDVPESIQKQLAFFIPENVKDIVCPLQPFFEKLYSFHKIKWWYAGHYHPSYLVNIEEVSVLPIGYLQKICSTE